MAQHAASRGARQLVPLVGWHARTDHYACSTAGRGTLRGLQGFVAYARRVGLAANKGALESLKPTSGACGKVPPAEGRAGRLRRPPRACACVVDRGPR